MTYFVNDKSLQNKLITINQNTLKIGKRPKPARKPDQYHIDDITLEDQNPLWLDFLVLDVQGNVIHDDCYDHYDK